MVDLAFACACDTHLLHAYCDDDCPCVRSVRVKHGATTVQVITTVRKAAHSGSRSTAEPTR